MRFFFYSHDGVGLGHVRRQIAIAAALQEVGPGAQVLLATSVDEVASLGLPPNVDTLKLPGIRKIANGEYSSRRLTIPKEELHRLRSGLLRVAIEGFRPDVVLVDKHPFGARGEMTVALDAAKSNGARLVLGLRDVLDDPASAAQEWAREQIQERLGQYFDLVLVYGERGISNPLPPDLLPVKMVPLTKYCGYVVGPGGGSRHERSPQSDFLQPMSHPTVLCTVGGGEDGFFLLKAFVQAAAAANWRGVAITGPLLSESELRLLQQMAGDAGVVVQSFVPSVSKLFWMVDALVCMGGYNTLLEALSQGVPTICVPRTVPRSEQLIRASAFDKLNLLRMIHPQKLTPEGLGRDIAAALRLHRTELIERANRLLNFDGAQTASRYLLALLSRRRIRAGKAKAAERAARRAGQAEAA
jgi:predicted glycosyltransferase